MIFMELTDEEWDRLVPLIPFEPMQPVRRGRPRATPRTVANAVVWILTTGERWARLPARYPSVPTCRRRFDEWLADGTLLRMTGILSEFGRVFSYLPAQLVPTARASNTAAPVAIEAPRIRGAFWINPQSWTPPAAHVDERLLGATANSVGVSYRADEYRGHVIRSMAVRSVKHARVCFRASAEVWRGGRRIERSGLIGARFDIPESAERFAHDWACAWVDRQEGERRHAKSDTGAGPDVDGGSCGPKSATEAESHSRSAHPAEATVSPARAPEWLLQIMGEQVRGRGED